MKELNKYLIDKDCVRKINLDVIPSKKLNHRYVYVDAGVHEGRVKEQFKTWYGREYEDYVDKTDIEHIAGWYYKWSYIRYDEMVEADVVCDKKTQFIKDNIVYYKDRLNVKITDTDNKTEAYSFYFDSLEDAKNKLEVISNKFTKLVTL